MGHKYRLAAGATLSLILAMAWIPAIAQDAAPTQSPPPGSLQGFQLDPSRDTSKPKPPEREGPEIDNRPAPLPTPSPTPAPAIVTPPPVIRTVSQAAAPASPSQTPARQQEAQRPAAQERAPTEPATPEAIPETTQPPVEVPTSPVAAPSAPTTQPTASQPVPVETPSGSNLPWIIAALIVAAIAALTFWLRRKRSPESAGDDAPVIERPAPPKATPKPVEPARPDRPKAAIAITFHPLGARNTLIGASVGYRIVLRNEGQVAAENVAIASMISNADARQEQGLSGFFAKPVYAPTHSAERIEPGSSVEFSGELRLASEAIVPIQLKDRALLIPLVAFSAHYGWDGGNGYSAAAFIVGEESDPPRERMAPFRVDQGPRQYRSVGSRAARTALVG